MSGVMTVARDPHFHPRSHDDWREYCEERSAIGEYERGMSRAESERDAAILAGPPPGQVGLGGVR